LQPNHSYNIRLATETPLNLQKPPQPIYNPKDADTKKQHEAQTTGFDVYRDFSAITTKQKPSPYPNSDPSQSGAERRRQYNKT